MPRTFPEPPLIAMNACTLTEKPMVALAWCTITRDTPCSECGASLSDPGESSEEPKYCAHIARGSIYAAHDRCCQIPSHTHTP